MVLYDMMNVPISSLLCSWEHASNLQLNEFRAKRIFFA